MNQDNERTLPMPPELPLPPEREELHRLFERASRYEITSEERRAQRRSWVVSEMMLAHPTMTRDEVERLYEEVTR